MYSFTSFKYINLYKGFPNQSKIKNLYDKKENISLQVKDITNMPTININRSTGSVNLSFKKKKIIVNIDKTA